MNITELIKYHVRKYLKEANERDSYMNIIKGSGNYDVTNADDLRTMFFDPSRKINNGEFVTIVYVSEVLLNKKFNADGYTDKNGSNYSSQEIEQQGRSFGKEYLNNFFDSDDYKTKITKNKGATRPFAIFQTTTQQLNWNAMNYGKSKDEIDKIFDDATDKDLNDFTRKDDDFKKRIMKYMEENPNMVDEIEHYISTNNFPRDIINKIRKTNLKNNGRGWVNVDGNDYVTRNANTGNEALRLTKSSNLNVSYEYYIVLTNGDIKHISKDEFFYLQKAFGKTNTTSTNPKDVQTSIRQAITAINKRYEFRNYLIPQIAKMSFTIDGKPITYCNHELNVGGIIIDADEFLNSPLSENKQYNLKNMKKTIKKSELKRLVEGVLSELDHRTYYSAYEKADKNNDERANKFLNASEKAYNDWYDSLEDKDDAENYYHDDFHYEKGKGWVDESYKRMLNYITESVIRRIRRR